jgi:hypothetical protein
MAADKAQGRTQSDAEPDSSVEDARALREARKDRSADLLLKAFSAVDRRKQA